MYANTHPAADFYKTSSSTMQTGGQDESTSKSFNLGKGRILTYGVWRGQERLDLRIWKQGDEHPTKDGVVLPLKRYLVLRRCMPDITNALKKVMDGGHIDMRIHLGGNVYAGVAAPYVGVNVRKWYRKDDELRPGLGLILHPHQWNKLCDVDASLNASVPTLENTVECINQLDHQNQLGMLQCSECCPDGYFL